MVVEENGVVTFAGKMYRVDSMSVEEIENLVARMQTRQLELMERAEVLSEM